MKKKKHESKSEETTSGETTAPVKTVHGTTTEPDKADIEEFKTRKEESKKAGEEDLHIKEDKQD